MSQQGQVRAKVHDLVEVRGDADASFLPAIVTSTRGAPATLTVRVLESEEAVRAPHCTVPS